MASKRKRRNETPQQIVRTRKRHIWLLLTAVLIVYASALAGGFVWSDHEDILQGQHRITAVSDVADAFSLHRSQYRARFDGAAPELNSGSWQPVTILSNSISWILWDNCALCWHLENIFWHMLVVIGLYVLGRHIYVNHRHGNGMAFWSAMLFAAHPAGISSVTWIGGRPVLLAAALGITSLAIFSRLQATTNVQRNHHFRWLIGAFICGLTAMLSAESAYLLPVAALLIAGFSAKQKGRSFIAGIAPMRWQGLLLLFSTLGIVLLYRSLWLGGLDFSGTYPSDSLLNNLGTGLRHLWHLIDQTLLPSEPVISDAWKISAGWDAGEVAALIGTVLLIGGTVFGLKLGHPVAFGTAWFLIWITPGVGLFPSEHYHTEQTLYLATWGLIFGLVYLVTRAWRPVGRQLARGSEAIIFSPILLVLIIVSAFSNARWWQHNRLFEGEIASDPHYIEGRVELAKSALLEQKPIDGLNHMLTAIESSNNKKYTGYWDKANGYRVLGQIQMQMALFNDAQGSFETATETRPSSALNWQLLAQSQIELADYSDAEAHLLKALAIRPQDQTIKADLGVCYVGLEQYAKGRKLLESALHDKSVGNFQRYSALAKGLIKENQFNLAIPHLEAALKRREDSSTRAGLALSHWKLGQRDQAYENLSMAMQAEDSSSYVLWVNEQINNSSSLLPLGQYQ